MEEEIINIATLTIDSEKAVGTIEQTKKSIWDLQKSNTELRKAIKDTGDVTGEQTKQFVEQEAEIKRLNVVYKTQQSAINEVTLAQVKESAAIKENAKTIDQANTQNKELLKTRNQLDASTTEGAQAIDLLNKKIDQNNNFIKSNSSELEKQKSNVGNYGMVTENLSAILTKQGGIFSTVRTQVEGFKSTVSGSINTVKDVHNSVTTAAQGIIGFGNASKAAAMQATTLAAGETIAATATEGLAVAEGTATVAAGGLASVLGVLLFPITAIIAAGLILYNIFKDYAPVINPIKDAITSLGAVFVVLKTAVLDLVTGTRSLSDIFSSLGSDISDATVETYKLEGAQRALTKAMDIQELSSARTATKVKELILQSKDLSKSVKERTALINKAQSLEENEFKNRFKNYKTEKDLIIDKIAVGKNLSEEDRKRLTAGDYEYLKSIAKKKKLDSDLVEAYKKNQLSRETLLQEDNQIQEKAQNYKNKIIEKQQAKDEKVNEKAAKDAEDRAKKQSDLLIKNLSDSKIKFETEKHAADEQLAFYIDYYQKLDKLQGGSDKVKNAQDLSAKLLDVAKTQIDGEIELQTKLIESKKTISDQEKTDLLANAQFLKDTETKRIEGSILNERDKNLALEEIQKGFLENVSTINKTFEDSEKARKEEQKALDSLDFEMRLLTLEEQGYSELELKKRILEEEHAEKLRLISLQIDSEGNLTKEAVKQKEIEDKKYAKATKEIDKELAKTKRAAVAGIAADAIAAAQSIFGESKALAVAASLINTYQGITAELSTKAVTPYEIGLKVANVAFVAASGFAAVKNILKTDKGSSSMDSSAAGGATAGTQTFENPAKTQTIAQLQTPPVTATNQTQTVLVLETLDEAKNNQQIKIKSN